MKFSRGFELLRDMDWKGVSKMHGSIVKGIARR